MNMIFDSMNEAVGHTPLVRLDLPASAGTEVYAKLELANAFGMKDRVAKNIVAEARRLGVLRPGAPVVESSSGTMALGVALVGRSLGHPVHIVTDPRTDPTTMAKLLALGCEVHVVPAMTDGGWQGARLTRLAELLREMPDAFWPQQYSNPDNPGAYRALAAEILEDLGPIDILVGAVGSGGSLCGTARALRRHLPGLRVIGVDSVGSTLFDQPDVPGRRQSGLGNSLHPNNLDRTQIDEVHWLNDHEAFTATRALAREQQIFAGNTSGSVYRLLRDTALRAAPGTRIAGIFPDRGDRYTTTVYSDAYWQEHRLTDLPLSEAPVTVDYGTEVYAWSRAELSGRPERRRHLLFVEANTSGTGVQALRTAARLGLTAVLLTSKPERYAGLDGTGCEVMVCDTNDMPGLRTLIQEHFRREEIAGITTTSDFYVPTVAALADWLGLPGNPEDATVRCRNKAELRKSLAAAGVGQPGFAVVTDEARTAAAVAAVGLPCVVKPADDSGSNDVLLCTTVEQAVAHAARVLAVHTNVRGLPTARTVLVEEYLDAPEYSVEMFGEDGEATCVGVTAKHLTGTPHFVESRHLFPAELPDSVREELTETVRWALKAVGIRSGPTHTEVKLTGRGPAIIEINPRLAGGMIPELIRLATGRDLLEQQIRAAAALPVDLAADRSGHAGIQYLLADRPGTLETVAGADEAQALDGVERVTVTAREGAAVRPPRNAYDRLGHIVAAGAGSAEVADALDAALRSVDVRLRPDA
ncbi:pyridoxal-phosphate dependent enzyme [Streptomyces griseus]|uniref:pyridoxal-phosphate dependent enzyme n=1 Tax=Streptomyces griseus TaxID=1911 RepID=UPI00224DE849|nr:pyridoxal-phosphate dependent enzyme [Streptomyces griseus]MCX4710131.1 ATP-grasp domain-containing protein [Streptomyces griseus]